MSSPSNDIKQPAEDYSDTRLLELLIVLAKHKKMITAVTTSAAILSVLVSLILPNIYTGTAKVLPPQQGQSSAALLLGQLGGLANLASGSLPIKNPSDLYVGILKSRTVADSIIGRFDMQNLYDLETMVDTRREFATNSSIAAGKDGLITIEFDDEDPKRAAAIANALVEELDKLTQSLAVTEAAQRRLFFERQLKQAKEDLSNAEVALKVTQEKTGLIKLDDQGRAIIEAVATLRGQISAKEVELRAMRTFTTDKNPEYMRAQQQLAGLRSELSKLERAQIAGAGDILLPTGRVPEAGLEYLRKYRDVKYFETMFEVLAKQFEVARMDEAKESALVQIVDRAVPPDKKTRPKRVLLVALITVLASIAAFLWALWQETRERMIRNPIQAARLDSLRQHLFSR